MAAQDYPTTGDTVTFGVNSFTGYIVQDYDLTSKTNTVAEIADEQGNVVHVRVDDVQTEGSITMVANGGSIPVAGEIMTYVSALGTHKYLMLEVAIKGSNKGFVTYTIKVKRYQYITLP